MKFLAGCHGPCITIVVPAHHPGAQEGSRRALVHSLARTAGEQMTQGKFAARAGDLLAPLEAIAQESGVEAGGAGFAIFRSPEYTARYYLPNLPVERLVIADHFHLTPFVSGAFAPQEFFVLGLSKKHLRLFRYVNGECHEVPLPVRVPPSLEAAGGFDQPDHVLNRAPAGSSTGAKRAVQFGTSTDRETVPEYLLHFFGVVDRELNPTLDGKPLLLMGVHEEVAAYRRAAKRALHSHVRRSGQYGFSDDLGCRRVGRGGMPRTLSTAGGTGSAEYQEMTDRGRTLADVPAVRQTAGEGRVHRLCVRSDTEIAGPDGEDLVNAAVAETLRNGGEVFMLPQDKLPAAHPLAAILRY